jgi:hypothetical protein
MKKLLLILGISLIVSIALADISYLLVDDVTGSVYIDSTNNNQNVRGLSTNWFEGINFAASNIIINAGDVFVAGTPTNYFPNSTNIQSYLEALDNELGALNDRAVSQIAWIINGKINGTGQRIDGLRAMNRPGTIVDVIITANEKGGNGTCLIDIQKHIPTKPITTPRTATAGTSIYTTQTNRPYVTGENGPNATDNWIVQTPIPDVTSFVAGDFFSIDIDDKGGQPTDVEIQVFVEYD